jgi:predicted CXXCH cytochrome family protein
MAASAGNVGANTAALQSQHPVGLIFNDGGNKTGLVGTAPLNNLPLYSATPGGAVRNRVECATCHSVHSNTNIPFLRVPNAQVCSSCHTN